MAGKIQTEIANYLALVHDLASGADTWTSRPAWLEFAPNNLCNLRCVMCEQSDGVPLIAMKRDEAERVLKQVLPSITLWTPTALSEPLLNDIKFVMEQARKHEAWLSIYTNATVLTRERFELIADRLYQLHISFDSHKKEVYEALRVRAEYETTVANIRSVLPLAAARAIPVAFIVTTMADNVADAADYVDFMADLGAAEFGASIRLQPLLDVSSQCKGRDITDRYPPEQIHGFLDKACERARARGVTLNVCLPPPFERAIPGNMPQPRMVMPDMLGEVIETVRNRYPQYCSMAAYYLKVHPNGNVHPCCRAPEELTMGNVKEQSIEEIWNGPKYREFRRRMFAGDYHAVCRGCNVLTGNPKFRMPEPTPAPA